MNNVPMVLPTVIVAVMAGKSQERRQEKRVDRNEKETGGGWEQLPALQHCLYSIMMVPEQTEQTGMA